jgi:hypothetical protein
MAFTENYLEPSYDRLARREVVTTDATIENLLMAAENIEAYISRGPAWMATALEDVANKAAALDQTRLDLALPQSMISMLGAGPR